MKISIALQTSYGLETVSVKCAFTSDMTAVSMINVYVKENNIAGNDNIDRLRTDIAGRYEISVEQIDIRGGRRKWIMVVKMKHFYRITE